jgi:hypothetical protein
MWAYLVFSSVTDRRLAIAVSTLTLPVPVEDDTWAPEIDLS